MNEITESQRQAAITAINEQVANSKSHEPERAPSFFCGPYKLAEDGKEYVKCDFDDPGATYLPVQHIKDEEERIRAVAGMLAAREIPFDEGASHHGEVPAGSACYLGPIRFNDAEMDWEPVCAQTDMVTVFMPAKDLTDTKLLDCARVLSGERRHMLLRLSTPLPV